MVERIGVKSISVVIPVYNVERFVDECIQSVVNQTFQNIEILIILGKSSDNSSIKCEQWEKRDSRIRLVYQNEGHLGTARNLGVSLANEPLLAFIDGDDWWDRTMLEKLYDQMIRTNADMVMCDRYNVYFDERGKERSKVWLTEPAMVNISESAQDDKELIRTIEVSVNGKLYRKDLFTENNIIQPDCFGEDRAIMHYLVANCAKIGRVQEPLYFYRAERPGNSVGTISTYDSASACMEYIHKQFENKGILYRYSSQLNSIFLDLSEMVRNVVMEKGETSQYEPLQLVDKFVEKHCTVPFATCWLFGSYSMRHSVFLYYPRKSARRHYSYMSIISTFGKPYKTKLLHQFNFLNTEQKSWLRADLNKSFLDGFLPHKNDIVFVDFLEERYDIIEISGTYLTDTPLLRKSVEIPANHRVIKRNSIECLQLWQDACMKLIDCLKERISSDRVVLVKFKLSKTIGREKKVAFSETKRIEIVNRLLDEYYRFFEEHFHGIKVIDCGEEYLYTDSQFFYGCEPWHMNELYYKLISEKIKISLKGSLKC